MDLSIYNKIGGEEVLQEVVISHYKKVLTDKDLAPFFEGVNMDVQYNKMKGFLTIALGGPGDFTGKGLSSTHKKLVEKGLNEDIFDKFITYLKESLEEHGATKDVIHNVDVIIKIMKPDILNK